MLKLLKFLKPYILMLIVLIILVYVQVMADLQLPDYMSTIVNEGIVMQNQQIILEIGGRMLAVALLGAACTVGVGFLASRIGAGFSRDLREKIFVKVESFSMTEFDQFSTASLITRSTNDVQQVQMVLIMLLRIALMAPIMGVGAIIKAIDKSPSMTWIIALTVAVLVCIIILLFSIALPRFKKLQKLIDRLNLVTRENLTGLRVIRAFNTEKAEEAKFDKANLDLTKVNLFVNRLMVIMQPIMMLLLNLTSIAIIWYGAHMIDAGNLMIGDMMAFLQYGMQVIMSFLFMSIVFIMVPRASVSAQRIQEVLATDPVIKDPQTPQKPTGNKGEVQFIDVTFAYPDADLPVLQNISFTAKPGETTAIIGSTGSGKSTLVNLIPRFFDVTEGKILVSGVDIREMTQEDLCEEIGYVPQKGVLFSGTVESNVKYGLPEASQLQMEEALRVAQAYDFVDQLEGKTEAPIAQSGTNVSGGQKQRLAIARALIKEPDIYIFDDSFSALDFRTDAALRKALAEKTMHATVLIVAQRISTILNAEKIIVLNEGKIVGMGRHRDLLKECKVYYEIAASQLTEEELA